MVARRAHNPKVVGSNPAPATNFQAAEILSGFFVDVTKPQIAPIRYFPSPGCLPSKKSVRATSLK